MNLNELRDNPGARTSRKRLGRGIGSGLGKTSGKGHKGARARTSNIKPPTFEGGQMPLHRRSPKWGFTNVSKQFFNTVNLDQIEKSFVDGETVSYETCWEKGLIRGRDLPVKVLGRGKLSKRLTFKVNKLSESAQKAVEAAKGSLVAL
mgnify:CR=1 FL=1